MDTDPSQEKITKDLIINLKTIKQVEKQELPAASPRITASSLTDRPHRALKEMMKKGELVIKLATRVRNAEGPVASNCVRFVCISDTHSRLSTMREPLPMGDVLLHAGDFTMRGAPEEVEDFNDTLRTLPYRHKIVIAGNHEITFDPLKVHIRTVRDACRLTGGRALQLLKDTSRGQLPDLRRLLTQCTYLEDSYTTICGIKIWGAPWQPNHSLWGFNLARGRELLEHWDLIPADVDVLITHGPPLGYGDMTKHGKQVGCLELLNTIRQRVRPAISLFGHIHEGYGVSTDGITTFINASTCNSAYHAVHKPIVFDMEIPAGHSRDELLQSLTVVASAEVPVDGTLTVSVSSTQEQEVTSTPLQDVTHDLSELRVKSTLPVAL